jgi:uncharacterized protein YodC (DUF2158 family)
MEIKIGTVVQLKSGGPKMTVQSIGDYSLNGVGNGALCVWFAGDDNKSEVFDIQALKICDNE